MKPFYAMSTKQVHAAGDAIFEAMADDLNASMKTEPYLGVAYVTPDDIQIALEAALAEQFAPAGGVLLVWWDRQGGLRLNPAPYPAAASGEAE